MPPILFLDFDGVLNSTDYLIRVQGHYDKSPDGTVGTDPQAAARLERLLTLTGAKVVLSSVYRRYHSLETMQEYLRNRGVPSIELIGATPHLTGYRGEEIHAWLKEHPEVTRFAIVDDDSDMEPYYNKLVKTSCQSGLLDRHVEQLIKLLS